MKVQFNFILDFASLPKKKFVFQGRIMSEREREEKRLDLMLFTIITMLFGNIGQSENQVRKRTIVRSQVFDSIFEQTEYALYVKILLFRRSLVNKFNERFSGFYGMQLTIYAFDQTVTLEQHRRNNENFHLILFRRTIENYNEYIVFESHQKYEL